MYKLRRSQTGQDQIGLSCKASKCNNAGTGALGVLITHETSLMQATITRTTHLASAFELEVSWATTIMADLEPVSGPQVFGHAQWRKDCVKVSSELAQDRRAWSASVRDVVNAVGDAGSTRPG